MNHCDPRQREARRTSKSFRNDLHLESGDTLELESQGEGMLRPMRTMSLLKRERGVWVFRRGKKLSAAVTDKALRKIRQERDCRNRGDGR